MQLKDNTILVIPHNIKNEIIKDIRKEYPLLNIKFITINEFIKNYYFNYTNETIYYLMNKYNYKYDVAYKYLKNIYYIKDNTTYKNNKLLKLASLKQELKDNNLLIYNNLFKEHLTNKNIIVYGFDSLNKLERETFNNLDNTTIVYNKKNNYKHTKAYEFNTLEDEVNYVCISIINLLNKGININNIKLLNVTSEYNNTLERYFKFYNIPIDINNNINLYSTSIGLFFINNLDKDINITLEKINNKFNLKNEHNLDIYNKLINIINEHTWCNDLTSIKELLTNELKNTYLTTKKYKNSINTININNNIFNDNNYYFLLNFNQGSIPTIHKDENYITDNITKDTLVDTTLEKNKTERNNILNILSRIKNLTITYKLHSKSGEYNISNINEELNLEIIKDTRDEYKYSNIHNKLSLAQYLDDMIKYNIKNKDINLLYNNYKDIKYLEYNNKFTGLNKDKLYNYLDNKLLLSYSTIDNFNRCGFRYYISNILKISIYEDTFMTLLGSLFHHILEISFKSNIDIDYEYEKYLKELNREFNIKERFFLDKLKNELKFIIDTIKLQLTECSLDKSLYEEKIFIDKSNNTNIKITFMGVIDKLMYKEEDNQTIAAIIDYKTGNPKIDLNTSIYGIEMQLPIYLYLASNTNKITNVKFAGFYLQKILNNEIVKDYINSYEDLKRNNLKLQGYSNEDINILSKFDKSYINSRVIKSMKTTQKGFSTYAKVLSEDKMNKLINIVDKTIDKSIDKILSCEFDINPKKIGMHNYGCEFCKFKDICFMSNNDIVNLKEYKNMEFLEDKEE